MKDFNNLTTLSKCNMANYCKYSIEDKYCIAEDETVDACPYLNAISQIAILSVELIDYKNE